jgi:hypothetical protein
MDPAGPPPRVATEDPSGMALLYRHLSAALRAGCREVRFVPDRDGLRVLQGAGGHLTLVEERPAFAALGVATRARILGGELPASAPGGARREAFTASVRTRIGGEDVRLEIAVIPTVDGDAVRIGLDPVASLPRDLAAVRWVTPDAEEVIGRLLDGPGLVIAGAREASLRDWLAARLLPRLWDEGRMLLSVGPEREGPVEGVSHVQARRAGALAEALSSYEPDVVWWDAPLEDLRAASLLARRGALFFLVVPAATPRYALAELLAPPGALPAALAWSLRGQIHLLRTGETRGQVVEWDRGALLALERAPGLAHLLGELGPGWGMEIRETGL